MERFGCLQCVNLNQGNKQNKFINLFGLEVKKFNFFRFYCVKLKKIK